MKKPLLLTALLVIGALTAGPVAWSEPPLGEELDLSDYRGKVVVLDFLGFLVRTVPALISVVE